MKTIVFLSLLEMLAAFDSLWLLIRGFPPMIKLPVVELVYVGDGYILYLGRGTNDIE